MGVRHCCVICRPSSISYDSVGVSEVKESVGLIKSQRAFAFKHNLVLHPTPNHIHTHTW